MTGTAATSARELKRIYRKPGAFASQPTVLQNAKSLFADRVFGSMMAKFEAIVDEVQDRFTPPDVPS